MPAVLFFIASETSKATIKALKDNQGTKGLLEIPLSSARSKHIDVQVEYVASAEQHADILTKALNRNNLEYQTKSHIPRLCALIASILRVRSPRG